MRKNIYVPSVSPEKEKRWSFSDLLAVRAIYWLRRDKPDLEIARTSMRQVRQALQEARRTHVPFSKLNIGRYCCGYTKFPAPSTVS